MPHAAHCSQCGTNVYVREDGRCPNGHGPESLSNYYEVDAWPGHAGGTGPSSMFTPQTLAMARWARVTLVIVVAGMLLMCCFACAIMPFFLEPY